ncbi:MAG: tRNA (adenosine(37)-N6)-threonylcarbamoyltransferase complex dimerization subunit type 1 TsaB [Defluviitaleaceae bacterium]|nr:tRNA (adenosine(37)-N6)-threonylcarbamoyltransferase complex dimerization subunit type 1 TsaB [Defluviitaleaceae bacterium]
MKNIEKLQLLEVAKINILAIDTSGKVSTVAISSNGRILGELSVTSDKAHSQTLMPAIATLLDTCEVDKGDLELLACVTGPGSFTGLRIGASVAKGLAFALNLKIVPISALDALAYNALQNSGLTVPTMDARRGQVYTAVYNPDFERIAEPVACEIQVLLDKLEGSAVFLGDGAEVYKDAILAHGHKIAPPHQLFQRASATAILAHQNQHKAVSPADFELTYIRQSQAEREKNTTPTNEA